MVVKNFNEFMLFSVNKSWYSLSHAEMQKARVEFVEVLKEPNDSLSVTAYNITGLKAGVDLLLLVKAASPDTIQQLAMKLSKAKLGMHLDMVYSFLGLERPHTYSKGAEQDEVQKQHKNYMVFYPFSKTVDWYLLTKEQRAEMMTEHISLGKKFSSVSQLLVYSFGLDSQEFIVAYETDNLTEFQDAVMALREVKVRKYTALETPVFVSIYRPLNEAINNLG